MTYNEQLTPEINVSGAIENDRASMSVIKYEDEGGLEPEQIKQATFSFTEAESVGTLYGENADETYYNVSVYKTEEIATCALVLGANNPAFLTKIHLDKLTGDTYIEFKGMRVVKIPFALNQADAVWENITENNKQ